MISLIIPPKDQLSRVSKMLINEYGTATNIKSRVNRLAVQGAINSVNQRLKLYSKVPYNGLIIYCGTIITEDNKEKKINIDFEPYKPINTSLYLCDNKFHIDPLLSLLDDEDKYGFIIIDGHGTLFGILEGNVRSISKNITVDLPKDHSRGGQSASRFARIRLEKRHNYLRKISEIASSVYITKNEINVKGIIIAGSAEFKTDLAQSNMFNIKLKSNIIKIVNISYGGIIGFNQAIDLSADILHNVKFIQEKKLINNYFDEISKDSGKYCFGINDTINALESGAVKILICWENLDIYKNTFLNEETNEYITLYLTMCQIKDKQYIYKNNIKLKLIESQLIIEWFINNYKSYGTILELISDKSSEGSRFINGFGGVGGILRYKIDFQYNQENN